jgi:hypothetical protein
VNETTSTLAFPDPSDGVEIKFSFSADRVAVVLDSFGLSEESAKRMRIFFFDALDVDGGGSRLRLLGHRLPTPGRRRTADRALAGGVAARRRLPRRVRLECSPGARGQPRSPRLR